MVHVFSTFKFYGLIHSQAQPVSFKPWLFLLVFDILIHYHFVPLTEKVSKYCDENGEWFRHPDSNRTWSNYTLCNAFTPDKLHVSSTSNLCTGWECHHSYTEIDIKL